MSSSRNGHFFGEEERRLVDCCQALTEGLSCAGRGGANGHHRQVADSYCSVTLRRGASCSPWPGGGSWELPEGGRGKGAAGRERRRAAGRARGGHTLKLPARGRKAGRQRDRSWWTCAGARPAPRPRRTPPPQGPRRAPRPQSPGRAPRPPPTADDPEPRRPLCRPRALRVPSVPRVPGVAPAPPASRGRWEPAARLDDASETDGRPPKP